MKCGLLGRRLGHSYSPQIHRNLGDYPYGLFEKEPEELEDFLRKGDFTGLNVTMPYKMAVIPFLDVLSDDAARLGAVNTIVRRDGALCGHNTDYFGFLSLLKRSGLSPAGKKCLVLGSGGASKVAVAVLAEAGADVVVISRSGSDNYGNLQKHQDAAILVNATPVGMYPDTGVSPVDLALFPRLEGVLDMVYNPARTRLLLDAEKRGLIALSGLWMLVAQAKAAAEWFTGHAIPEEKIEKIHSILKNQSENIILIGMPGCGKSTVGRLLAEITGRVFVDADAEIVKLTKKSIPDIFAQDGEEAFRALESQVLTELGKQSSLVIATGGGCVTRAENYPLLHQNGRIFWLQRNLEKLPKDGRPPSQGSDLLQMYEHRAPMYAAFADHMIDNNRSTEEASAEIRNYYTDTDK